MNVGFCLLTLFPGRVGGSETNVRGLLREFARGSGPERVTVLANRHVVPAYEGLAGGPVTLHHVRSYRPGDRGHTRLAAMLAARLLPGLAARDVPAGLDLWHYPVTVPIPEAKGPSVVTLFDVQHHELPEFFSRAERAYRRWAYDGAARRATRVVTTSEYSRERIVEIVGVEPERVDVVHVGVDLDRFGPEPAGDEGRLLAGLDLPERFLVYPANAWPHKNHARLLEAFERRADQDLWLLLTGQTYGRLGELPPHVRHLGFVAHDALPALYRRAAGMVFPSLYEGFGLPVLEAMACGCPVAASRSGSLAEVAGDVAIPLDPLDVESIAVAIDRLGAHGRTRGSGLDWAARFTWPEAAARHREIYARAAREFDRSRAT